MRKLGFLLLSAFAVMSLGCDDKGMTIGSGECLSSQDCPHPTLYKCVHSLGVCVEANPGHCFDYVQNEDETDVDCGGMSCDACAEGAMCGSNSDCVSGLCEEGACVSVACDSDAKCAESGGHSCNLDSHTCNTCKDGVMNGLETARDCGGPCGKCGPGLGCRADSDCLSGSCASGVCSDTMCRSDGECPDRYMCASGGICIACIDNIRNGTETDTDCGGSSCPACADGKACAGNSDCLTGNCESGICKPKVDLCKNGAQDPGETDVDCGGPCAQCGVGKKCGSERDCTSWMCQEGTCQGVACETVIANEVLINEVFTNPDTGAAMHHSSSKQMKYIELYNSSAKRANIGELHIAVRKADGSTGRISLAGCLDANRYLILYPQGEKLEALDLDAISVASADVSGAIDSTAAFKVELVNTRSSVAVHKVQLPDMSARKGISAARPASPAVNEGAEVFVEHSSIKADDGTSENPYSPGLSNSIGVPMG